MKTFGLTGGIGMGKSTAAQLLQARGVAVVDTDDLARQVVAPGQPAWREVQGVFGKGIIGPEGELRRNELARLVFSDLDARRKLEAILHPRIQELWSAQLTTWRGEGRTLAVVVIPLLYETQAEAHFDAVICVACTAATQQERLLARGWTAAESAQRIAAQWPVAQKMAQADYVVWTEAGTDVHAQQLGRIIGISANEK